MRVDDRCGSRRQPAKILRHGQLANRRLRIEKGLERDRRGMLAGPYQLAHDLEQLAMQRLEEMASLQEARNPVEALIINENRAEQSLLGLDIVRGLPEGQRIQAFLKGRLGGKSGKGGGAFHGEELELIRSGCRISRRLRCEGRAQGCDSMGRNVNAAGWGLTDAPAHPRVRGRPGGSPPGPDYERPSGSAYRQNAAHL